MKIAAVDIGTNAIRFQVSSVLERDDRVLFKKLQYVRFPLRLGHDVFTTNRIGEASIDRFKKLMRTYKLLLELYEVDAYRFCATSAMRESENGRELAAEVKQEIGIEIEIIDGDMEAELIQRAIFLFLDDGTYLHIDVGGGSTELNLFTGRNKIATKSFKLGSVRLLEGRDSPGAWSEMQEWIEDNVEERLGLVTAVGTGGNISKLYEVSNTKPGKRMSLKKLLATREMIEAKTLDERIYELQMNPDRADVIVPASNIYAKVMKWARVKQILVPEVGLKDGILLQLFESGSQPKTYGFANADDEPLGSKTTRIR
jgi:exopolyphosphatase/guanosine-5'-triphosphate,3'-diphosphate pyrophosphatase